MPLTGDRIQETTTTTGTGTLTLAGAVTGFRTFNTAFTNGDIVFYTIDNGAGQWEVGIGTVGTNSLSRTSVIASSNSNALVSFSAGSKRVFCTAPTRTILPDQTNNSGKVLSTDGTSPSWLSTANWDSAYTDRLKWDGGATGLTAATGRTSLGATTVGGNLFTLTNPSAVTFPRFNADNTVSALSASDARTALGLAIGTNVQAYDADLDTWATKTAPSGTAVGTTDTQTLSNKTLTGTKETVYTITDGASVDIDPANGGIQVWTLGASRTPTATNFTAGQSVLLLIADGTAYAVTWTTIGVTWVGGSAPTLPTSGYGAIELWKVSSTVYGAYVGSVA